MPSTPLNPRPYLASLIGKDVIVKLKWGLEYRGKLMMADAYMNLQLANAEEFIDDITQGRLGKLLVRCNNILYVRSTDSEIVGGKIVIKKEDDDDDDDDCLIIN